MIKRRHGWQPVRVELKRLRSRCDVRSLLRENLTLRSIGDAPPLVATAQTFGNYPGVNTVGKDRDTELARHPTVKPSALVADAILDCSKRGGIILDPFAGSGTTLIAAEKTGRRGYGIEIDPHYTDTIIRRFDEVYGLKAIHAESKVNFEGLRNNRSKEKHHGHKAKKGAEHRAESRPR